jgi:hypothetical protein
LDDCDSVAGTCSAEPVAECSEVTYAFAGTVDFVAFELESTFTVGDEMRGRYTFDPMAPDANPLDSSVGAYPSGAGSLTVEIDDGVSEGYAASSSGLVLLVEDDGNDGDLYAAEALDTDGLSGDPIDELEPDRFTLSMVDESASALTGDGLPSSPPDPAAFDSPDTGLALVFAASARGEGSAVEATLEILQVPEPALLSFAAASLLAVAALARRRRR